MSNISFGILTISICTIGYFFSWKQWKKENFIIAVLLLMVCGLVLRIYTSADFFLHTWDERYHALVSKNLINHPLTPTLYDKPILPYNYQCWSANHVWLHKQPLPLWTMALSMYIFGVNEIALRIPSIILTTIGILLTFKIGSYLFSKKTGYLAAFFYSINGLIIELTAGRTATDHIDIFLLFFIELAILLSILFAYKKKVIYNILAGVSIGAAVLSKAFPAFIVLPIWILIVYDSGNFKMSSIIFHFFFLLITCIAIFLPWQIYIFKTFPLEADWEMNHILKHIAEVTGGQSGPFYYYINKIRMSYGELIYLPLLWFLWKTYKNTGNLKLLAISLWFLIPIIFFSFAKTKMQAYILFTSPALFIITSEFYFMLSERKREYKLKWIFNIILLLLIALPVRYSIERIKPFDNRDRRPVWVTELKKLKDCPVNNGVLFNYDRPIEAMFYTNLTVYAQIPGKKVILNLIEQGYSVYIKDDRRVLDDIKDIENIILIKCAAAGNPL